jgi:hypothetical protein
MPATTNPPPRPTPVRLDKIEGGRYPRYRSRDGRFTITRRRPDRDTPYEDSGFDVVDTAGRNVLGHAHTNHVRVFEVEDAKAIIDRVLDVEWLGKVQSFHDAECRRAGIPTVVEREQARMREDRSALPPVRIEP